MKNESTLPLPGKGANRARERMGRRFVGRRFGEKAKVQPNQNRKNEEETTRTCCCCNCSLRQQLQQFLIYIVNLIDRADLRAEARPQLNPRSPFLFLFLSSECLFVSLFVC